MRLVEAESTGPVEGDAALVTAPRPPRRRVSVSLVFTLTVLIGTVVTIYAVFPPRHNVLMTEAIARHGDVSPIWDLAAPGPDVLRGWMIGVVGKGAPLPGEGSKVPVAVIGARQVQVLKRAAAVIRVRVGDDLVTYVVQHARGIPPEPSERVDGSLRAIAWRKGPFALIAVGSDATAASWRAAFR